MNRQCRRLELIQEICTFTFKEKLMCAIVIKPDSQSSKILKELTERLGADVTSFFGKYDGS
jgi:hypothetical protein